MMKEKAMNAMKSIFVGTLFAAGLGACASAPYGYSQLDGHRYHRAPIDTHPLIISRVDGASTLPGSLTLVEPGPRKIVVQAFPTRFQRLGEERVFELDVAPCTRYYLVAVKANSLASDFDVKVDHQEPVGGCTAPKT
jgi:hypothetical protein